MLNGPNGPVGNFSLIEVAELQFGYIMQLVERLRAGECREVERRARRRRRASRPARTEAAQHTIWATGCRSWYLDDRGVPWLALHVRPLPRGDGRAEARAFELR